MQLTVKFESQELENNLQDLGDRKFISRAVKKALFEVAITLRKDLFQWTPQDSRQLLDSWEIQWAGDLTIEAGYNEVYAMYQEMGMRQDGTHGIRQRPAGGKTHFFKETFEDHVRKYLDIFEEELWDNLL